MTISTSPVPFEDAMTEVHRLFEGGDHDAALQASQGLSKRLLLAPIVDAEQLGWAVYYQFRSLHALGDTDAAWALLNSDELSVCRIPPKSEAWMWSVGAELASNKGLLEDLLRCGEECYARRYATNDGVGQKQCCETVCTLLGRMGRAAHNREFAWQLVVLGRAHDAVVPVMNGLRFLLEAFDGGAESVREYILDGVGELAWIDPEARRKARDELLAQVEATLGVTLERTDDGSPKRGPAQGARPYDLAPSLAARAFRRAVAVRDRKKPVTVSGLSCFAALLDLGFERVCYESHLLDDGAMFWITDTHAEAIARGLRPSLRALHLCLTCFEQDGFRVMAQHADGGIELEELTINHRSGDEVTVREARGLARLATKVGAMKLSLWALEYEPPALDALADELERLDNRTLVELDICDTSRAEPNDRIEHPKLVELGRRNRARAGPIRG